MPVLLAMLMPCGMLMGKALTLYVSPCGNDTWSGTRAEPNAAKSDGPFATLTRARDEIRRIKKSGGLPKNGLSVEILGGLYTLSAPLALTAEDSGTDSAPIVWRARQGDKVQIVGGVKVSDFKPVTDPAVLKRLDEAAQGQVFQTDLRQLGNRVGITDFGQAVNQDPSANRLELFFQNKPMTLARWPNVGYAKIYDVPEDDGSKTYPEKKRSTTIPHFVYAGDRPSRWVDDKDVWFQGFWYWDWEDHRQRLASIDTTNHIITLAPPNDPYGYCQGQVYYALNLLSELDTPCEWYYDQESGILYFWPPAPLDQGRVFVSVIPTVLTMDGTKHVTFRRLTFEVCQGTAITVENADNVRIVGCTIRNAGSFAITITGRNSAVIGCDIYETGDGGIILTGGDRATLTPGNLAADNNHIYDYSRWNRTYQPGITLAGVGNRATHNLIDNAPHQAIAFSGNDHVIEFNEIHSVCFESNDAGAIYAGRDWTWRGTLIRYNYLHDITGFEGRGALGVYLDDTLGGVEISGNLFCNITNSVNATKAATSTCGRDCMFLNNIYVNCEPAVEVASRPQSTFIGMKRTLDEVPYQNPLWTSRYPKLAVILDDEPMKPKGNVVARNICVGGKWTQIVKEAQGLVTFQDNLVDQDPHFVDAKHGNFQLKRDSPAWKLGFKRIPIEKIGLYKSEDRASWPASDPVRPAGHISSE
jgi:hypothetical protein